VRAVHAALGRGLSAFLNRHDYSPPISKYVNNAFRSERYDHNAALESDPGRGGC
jgi:hypothetical protein